MAAANTTKLVAWIICLLWTGYHTFLLFTALSSKGISAIQESSAAAVTAALIVAGYVATRAIVSITDASNRAARQAVRRR